MPTDDDPDNLSFLKWLVETAKELDALTTAALLSVLGGSVAFATGYYEWIPFAMALPMAGYKVAWELVARRDRLAIEEEKRRQQEVRDRIELIDKVKDTLSLIDADPHLTEEEKKFLKEKVKLLLEEKPSTKMLPG